MTFKGAITPDATCASAGSRAIQLYLHNGFKQSSALWDEEGKEVLA